MKDENYSLEIGIGKFAGLAPLINPNQVEDVFIACLVANAKAVNDSLIVEGITGTYAFDRNQLDVYTAKIIGWLNNLPDVFFEKSKNHPQGGGGMSFLHALEDKNGVQWTDLHQRMEQLLVMGLAIQKVTLLLPRPVWSALPGGMPYFLIKD